MAVETWKPWRNRIVGYGEVDPKELLANPWNWKIHPRGQQIAIEGILTEIGWVDDVIVNVTTDHMVDGHVRVLLAIGHNEPSVPVKYVELTEEEEKVVIMSFDPLGARAVTDRPKLQYLLDNIKDVEESIKKTLAEIAEEHGLYSDTVFPDVPPIEQNIDKEELLVLRVTIADEDGAILIDALEELKPKGVKWSRVI